MIGDREIDLQQLCQATEEALGLAKRKMEDHADRQRCLDRDVRNTYVDRRVCRWPGPAKRRAEHATATRSGRHDAGARPRIQARFVSDTETSRACTGFASDTSSLAAPGSWGAPYLEATTGSRAPTPVSDRKDGLLCPLWHLY